MRLAYAAVIAWFLLVADSDRSTFGGLVTFDNDTSVAGQMIIDGIARCRAPAYLSCTSQVEAGAHIVEFRFDDGDVVRLPAFVLESGETRSIPVREKSIRDLMQP